MKRLVFAVSWTCLSTLTAGVDPFHFSFDSKQQQWSLSNGVIHSVFQLTPDGIFQLNEIDNLQSGVVWKAPTGQASSPISVNVDGAAYDATAHYRLIGQRAVTSAAVAAQQFIVLQDLESRVRIRLELDMYAGQPVLRHHVSITNLKQSTAYAQAADLAPYRFSADAQTISLRRVAQWTVAPTPKNFQTSVTTLDPDGTPVTLLTGSQGTFCTWLALADENNRGLFAGWEFDGQALAGAHHTGSGASASVQLSVVLESLHHPIAPGATFELPAAFIGVYQGDWDEAGYRTQKFSESVLATPAPPDFPYMSWDSWGYGTVIDEGTLRANAAIAARLGVELFIVDLGWAREIGDWREDPAKFPSGLRALSDYVHLLGMKFGLHFALAEVMADAPVLTANPDWTSSESGGYYGALSLCLSNRATREWIVQQAVALIDKYNVDWILQDGAGMVKHCTKTTHTHDPSDSNYANAVEGIEAAVAEIRRQRPGVLWENCEDGGNMMTFSMVQRYVTSITNDASGALGSRQGAYGATYPFSPRYANRYMPEDPGSSYDTRSYIFGGPWHLMNQLPQMSSDSAAFAASEIAVYKNIRNHVRTGLVYHSTDAPAAGRADALESYLASDDTAIAVVTRDNTAEAYADIKLQGLTPGKSYQVSFETDSRILAMTGQQLSDPGVRVNLPQPLSAEIVYVKPLK